MSMHNGTDSPAARVACRCGFSTGERRNGSTPASHAVPPAPAAPPAPETAAAEPAAPRMTVSARRFRMQVGDAVIEVEWDTGSPAPPQQHVGRVSDPGAQTSAGAPASVSARAASPEVQEASARYVRAPLVGTFYHAPEAGARPFVGVGDVIQPGQTVGIIEVMKMMNPVTADVAGRVVEMIVGDARPVEYDQPLIALEPLGSG